MSMSFRPMSSAMLARAVCVFLLVMCTGTAIARAQVPGETIEYYAYDAVGSVRVVFNPAGTLIGRGDYLPFGEELPSNSGLPNERFTGQARDLEAGLDYFNARSYQVRHGRFTRPDPIFTALVQPQRWNRYSYALNNPLSFVDLTGLSPCPTDYCEEVEVPGGNPGGNPGSGFGDGREEEREGRSPPGDGPQDGGSSGDPGAPGGDPGNDAGGTTDPGPVFVPPGTGGPIAVANPLVLARIIQGIARGVRAAPWLRTALGFGASGAMHYAEYALRGAQHTAHMKALYAQAAQRYPKANPNHIENHHIWPQFLGGPRNGPTVPLPEPYHEMITQAFRREWKYGGVPPSPAEAHRIMIKVYMNYPIFPTVP